MSDTVPCNYCGADDATVVFGPGVAQISQVVRCNRCGLMYASPRAKVPDSVEVTHYDPNFNNFRPGDTREVKEKLQVKDYKKTRDLLNELHPQRGKLMEIGSSLGYLIDAFRSDGWDVLGVEPFYQCCRYAREKHGLEVFNGILEDADIPDESYDVVLLNHVIEHLDNPMQTLREVNRVLKPNGHFVIETPRYDTLMFKLMGRRERSVSCGGHIYFFTTESLKNLYEAAGFKTVQLDYVGRSLSVERLLYNVGVVSKSKSLQRAFYRTSQRLRLGKIPLYLNFRDMQRVCIQKVAAPKPAPAIEAAAAEKSALVG